jgi:thioredoxin reductase (NADPH)
MADHETEALIIGAGPVGLFAVFEFGMLRIKCHVVDVLEDLGGQCTALYPEKPIFDVPAHPRILAADLIDRLQEQAAPFAPTYHLGRQVVSVARQADGSFLAGLSNGDTIRAKVVVIAAGVGAFGPNRPPLAGLETFEGKSVFYLVRRREDFRGKRVVIAGGGDSAVDWALSLAEVAARVMVVHRRDKFRCAPESESRLKALAAEGKVEMVIPYQLHGLDGVDGRLHSVTVATLAGETRSLPADVLLPFFGLASNLGPIAEWGLGMDRNLIAIEPATCMSSVPGLFAIGDIASYPGKLKLILQGFSEAAMAAHAAFAFVHPGEALHFEHSTTTGLPGASS